MKDKEKKIKDRFVLVVRRKSMNPVFSALICIVMEQRNPWWCIDISYKLVTRLINQRELSRSKYTVINVIIIFLLLLFVGFVGRTEQLQLHSSRYFNEKYGSLIGGFCKTTGNIFLHFYLFLLNRFRISEPWENFLVSRSIFSPKNVLFFGEHTCSFCLVSKFTTWFRFFSGAI